MRAVVAGDLAWVPRIAKGAGPVYLAIADALAEDILSGRLGPGMRLPPQRTLADALDIDFTTVTRAYTEARKRGLVEGKVGQGTYVRPRAAVSPSLARGGAIDMSMNLPPRFDDRQLAAQMWSDIASLEHAEGIDLLLRYQEPGGTRRDQNAGALWLAHKLGEVALDRIVVTPGARGALLTLLAALAEPGDAVCTEALTFPGVLSALAHLRLRAIGVAIDRLGIIPDAFEAACRTHRPKLLYCNPTLHNPTTATMPLERREAVIRIARAHGVAIIEDDAYGMLPPRPVPPLARLAPDLVYHVAGLAKCLAPALRIAYLVLPETRPPQHLAGGIRAAASLASPLTAAVATRWIETGTAGAVLEAIRHEAEIRRALARDTLPREGANIAADGFHVWLELPPTWPRAEFVARLRTVGIGAVPSDAFAVSAWPEAVRLGLGVPATARELSQGLQTVAALLDETPALSSIVV